MLESKKRHRLKKVAVTGLIASGKSAVCHIMQSLGAFVISSDNIVKDLLETPKIVDKMVALFGSDILIKGRLDHSKVADMVFANNEKLHELEALLHPYIFKQIEEMYHTLEHSHQYKVFIAEVPLLFEVNWQNCFDVIITVDSKEENCQNRFLSRGKPLSDFERRKKRQWPFSKKKPLSHYIINNNSDLKHLEKETKSIFNQIT